MADLSTWFGAPSDELYAERRRRRPRHKDPDPLALAIRSLRSLGYGVVCADEPNDRANLGRTLSGSLAVASVVGTVLSSWLILGRPFWLAPLIVCAVPFVTRLLGPVFTGVHQLMYLAVLGTWLWCSGLALATGRAPLLWITVGIPLFLSVGGLTIARAVQLAVRVPLFLPAGLAIVVAPLLTEDPWAFVAQSRWRLVFLAVIALVPLLALVLRRLRRVDLAPIFDRAVEGIEEDVEAASRAGARMLNGRILRSREHWADPALLRRMLARSYQRQVLHPAAAELHRLTAGVLRRQSVGRFLTLLAGTTASTYLLNYLLVALALPRPLAGRWSGVEPSTVVLGLPFAVDVTLPLWPYTGVAGLFAIVAAVGFLAFSLTDETYTTALTDAVFVRPAGLLLRVGALYLHQRKRWPQDSESSESVADAELGVAQYNRATRRAMRRGGRKSR